MEYIIKIFVHKINTGMFISENYHAGETFLCQAREIKIILAIYQITNAHLKPWLFHYTITKLITNKPRLLCLRTLEVYQASMLLDDAMAWNSRPKTISQNEQKLLKWLNKAKQVSH